MTARTTPAGSLPFSKPGEPPVQPSPDMPTASTSAEERQFAPPEAIAQLIHAMPLAPGAEITLEANPGQLDHRGLQALIQSGVNRLSVGVQIFPSRPCTAPRARA